MTDQPPVSGTLEEVGIPHRVFTHPIPPKSLEQAAVERGQTTDQVVRSILFRKSRHEYLMVLVAGHRQVNWKALRAFLGTSRITMASPGEVITITGYKIGAVAPFGIPTSVRILVDESVKEQEEVSLGSGIRGTAIILKTSDLLKALNDADVGNFTAMGNH